MQEENARLIDEASQSEAVKNTFRLGWEFIRLNQTFTLTVLGALIVLNFLGMIPVISLIASMLAGVFGIALQIYAGRAVYEAEDITSYVEFITKSQISDESLKGHMSTAFGAYMGWVVLILVFVFVASILAVSSGLVTENMTQENALMALASIGLPLVIVALVLSYVQPLVHSNIVLANDFPQGFKAVFTIFSKDVWSSAMQKSYFSYVALFGIFIMLCIIPFAIVFATLGMGLLLNVILVIGSYVLMIILSVGAMMARRIVEE
jgi:hypothetical protein